MFFPSAEVVLMERTARSNAWKHLQYIQGPKMKVPLERPFKKSKQKLFSSVWWLSNHFRKQN